MNSISFELSVWAIAILKLIFLKKEHPNGNLNHLKNHHGNLLCQDWIVIIEHFQYFETLAYFKHSMVLIAIPLLTQIDSNPITCHRISSKQGEKLQHWKITVKLWQINYLIVEKYEYTTIGWTFHTLRLKKKDYGLEKALEGKFIIYFMSPCVFLHRIVATYRD